MSVYHFEISSRTYEQDEISIIADTEKEAEEEIRVVGILCGGISIKRSEHANQGTKN